MTKKLTRREKYSIYAGSGILCLFVLVQFIVFPSIDKRERFRRSIQAKKVMLDDMMTLKAEYAAVERRNDLSKVRFKNRDRGFTLFSFLDRLTSKTGIKDHVTYMKPSTSVQKDSPFKISQVEMKLKGLTLEQLISYLYNVETSKNMITIKKLSISKTGKQEGFIDAVLQVETTEIQ
jgi:general secretion pathway protein M